jgi:hypothetical protein
MLSFHRNFVGSDPKADAYLNNLSLRAQQRTRLTEARRLIRERLRSAFAAATAHLTDERPLTPAFFTQGSWAYHTINRGTHIPPQRTDMDDGCYLPMPFITNSTPKRAADWYFAVADAALKLLVAEQGWKAYDNSKPTCCRVVLDDENHVDIPLYAISDEKFTELKRAQVALAKSLSEAAASEDDFVFDWSMVSDKDVLLAQRNGRWKPSEPKVVHRWVEAAVAAHGAQLRDTWRSAKGWRDQQFPHGDGPSSICLMAIIEDTFQKLPGRTDETVRQAMIAIKTAILKPVIAPWDDLNEDLNRLSVEARHEVVRRAEATESEMSQCMLGKPAEAAQMLKRLQVQMGRHFSDDVSRVEVTRAPEVIRSYAAATVSIPELRGDNKSA